MALPTNFKDDVLSASMNKMRRYEQIYNDDGSVSLEDVTEYEQIGSRFGAAQVNETNKAINDLAQTHTLKTYATPVDFGATTNDSISSIMNKMPNGAFVFFYINDTTSFPKVYEWVLSSLRSYGVTSAHGGVGIKKVANIHYIAWKKYNENALYDTQFYQSSSGMQQTSWQKHLNYSDIIDTLSGIKSNTESRKAAGALPVKEIYNTLEARTNGKAKIWEDGEGGNVQVESPGGVKWQMDAYDGNFRAYRNANNTIKPIFTFQGTDAGGDVLTSSKIIDSLSDVAANTTAKKIAGALAVKSLNTLVAGVRTYSTASSHIGSYDSANVRRKVWILQMSGFTEPASGIQTINVNSGVKFGVIFRLQAFAKNSGGNVYPLPYTANSNQFDTWLQSTDRKSDGDRFIFKNRLNWGAEYNLYIIAEYTEAT